MKPAWRHTWTLLKETGEDWVDDNAARLAAALAYYTLLSLAPLLIVAISVAGFFLGDAAARGSIANELANVVGPQAADSIQEIISHAEGEPAANVVSSIIGVVVLLIGASGAVRTSDSPA